MGGERARCRRSDSAGTEEAIKLCATIKTAAGEAEIMTLLCSANCESPRFRFGLPERVKPLPLDSHVCDFNLPGLDFAKLGKVPR